MDFQTTKETIIRWIYSCETLEQMQLCSDAIDMFIIDRFAGKVEVMEFSEAVCELHEAMADREVNIVMGNVSFCPNFQLN